MTQLLIFLLLPLGAGAIAGLGAAAGLIGQGINAVFTKNANRRNQQLAQEAYTRERQDNLADWTRQNAYNHPSEQMKRLKEAGLNPNLVYGSGATTTAGSVSSAKQQVPDNQPLQANLGGIVQQFVQTMQMQQATDNLREINKNLVLKQQLQKGQILRTDIAADRDQLLLESLPETINLTQTGLQLKNNLTNTQITFQTDENIRRAALTTQSLKEGLNRLMQQDLERARTKAQTQQIRKQIELMNKDSTLKDVEIKLSEWGLSRGSSDYMKILKLMYDKFTGN